MWCQTCWQHWRSDLHIQWFYSLSTEILRVVVILIMQDHSHLFPTHHLSEKHISLSPMISCVPYQWFGNLKRRSQYSVSPVGRCMDRGRVLQNHQVICCRQLKNQTCLFTNPIVRRSMSWVLEKLSIRETRQFPVSHIIYADCQTCQGRSWL